MKTVYPDPIPRRYRQPPWLAGVANEPTPVIPAATPRGARWLGAAREVEDRPEVRPGSSRTWIIGTVPGIYMSIIMI
jgi:hypothetical protein